MSTFRTLPIRTQGVDQQVTPPFYLSKNTDDQDNLIITVFPGTVNQFLPDNMFETFNIDDTGTFWAKLQINTDGQNIQFVQIAIDTNENQPQIAVPSSLPTYIEILIGIIKDGNVYSITRGNFSLVGQNSFNVPVSSPADPGTPVFTSYYVWQVSTY